MTNGFGRAQEGEPLLLVPWPVPAFALAFVAIHLALEFAPPAYVDWSYYTFALTPTRFTSGDGDLVALGFAELLTHGFLHFGWWHLLINVTLIMAAAGPVYRNCGLVGMWLLFALSVVAGGAAHVLIYWGEPLPVLGASGGAAGLIGAALRYRTRRLAQGEIVAPIMRPPVSTFSLFWLGINAALFLWDSFGSGAVSGYATIAHIGGYLAGLFLAPVLVRGARPRQWRPLRGDD